MKVAVFGASGMLGHTLSKLLVLNGIDATFFARGSLPGDMSKFPVKFFDAITYDPKIHDFDFVVNCCGAVKQRNVSDELFYQVNADFPKRLAKKYGNRMIHISTDCVFSGSKGLYVESSEKDCTDAYGMSKSEGENSNCRILRTSIIGTHPTDHNGLLEWFRNQKNDEVRGFVDHIWGGVTTLKLSQFILQEMKNKQDVKLRHVYSERISKFELLNLIAYTFDIKTKIIPIMSGKVDRSLFTELENNPSSGHLIPQLQEMAEFERMKL